MEIWNLSAQNGKNATNQELDLRFWGANFFFSVKKKVVLRAKIPFLLGFYSNPKSENAVTLKPSTFGREFPIEWEGTPDFFHAYTFKKI